MPTISMFYGIVIRMYWKDHARPHLHAFYSGDEAAFSVSPAKKIAGRFPKTAIRLVLKWVKLHKRELMKDWDLASSGRQLVEIPGLDE